MRMALVPDATTPPALAPAMQREIPEVEQCYKGIYPDWGQNFFLNTEIKNLMKKKFIRADSSFFNVFTFPF